jgi:hypothetical protein
LVKTIYMAMNQYRDLLGESKDATNPWAIINWTK